MLDKSLNLRPICLRNMRLSNILLKMGAEAGLNLGEICKIWCRTDDEGEVKSILEGLVERAQRQADIVEEIRNFRSPKLNNELIADQKSNPDSLTADLDVYEEMKAHSGEDCKESMQSSPKRKRANSESIDYVQPLKFENSKAMSNPPKISIEATIPQLVNPSDVIHEVCEEEPTETPTLAKAKMEEHYAIEAEYEKKNFLPSLKRAVSISSKLNVLLMNIIYLFLGI